jgi:lysophospholipase L1-like esterase
MRAILNKLRRPCDTVMRMRTGVLFFAAFLAAPNITAADAWVGAWVASVHGPYPAGNAVAQPDLRFAFPEREANDQTFRLIIKPDIWGGSVRLRLSNVFGSKAITFDGVYVGLHQGAGAIVRGTNRPVRFTGGKQSITIAPGEMTYSDPVDLKYPGPDKDGGAQLAGRKLAVSFHLAGASGPMTWHAKGMTTSYVSRPQGGAHGGEEASAAFPFTTTSWYFLDAVDMMMPAGTRAIAAFGDSITDGTNSTINGDDRWPDFLAQRVHALFGARYSVVDAGIGGNQILAPAVYDKAKANGGGPSALDRLDRDLISIPGLSAVVWLEGINDLGTSGATAESVIAGMRQGVARLHAHGIKVIGATITSSRHSTATHGTPEVDARRKAVNEFIRTGGVFDGVADFDHATLDSATGALRPEFQPSSSIGGPGDRLHPNRAGYQAMAGSVDLNLFRH